MNSLGSLIQKLLDHISALWPLALVKPWEQGVRLFAGRITALLTHENGIRGTGLHWHWPVIGDVYTQESNVEVFETEPQTVLAADGKEVTFTLGLQCQITRLDLFFANVNDDLKATVADAVRSVAGEGVRLVASDKMDTEWLAAQRDIAAKRMSGWGVKLLRVSLITNTTAPTLRIIGIPRGGIGSINL